MTTKLAFQPACDFLPGDGSSIRSEQRRTRGRFVPLRDAFRQEIARTSANSHKMTEARGNLRLAQKLSAPGVSGSHK
jgi:hypothetical protein